MRYTAIIFGVCLAGLSVADAAPPVATTRPADAAGSSAAGVSSRQAADQARLQSLRRSVAYLGNLDAIIARYQQAMGGLADQDVVEEAQQDLEMWQQRREQGCQRLGNAWLRPDQIALVRERPGELAGRAAEFASAKQWDKALPLLDIVAQVDPKNPTAQYLIGLVAWRNDRLTAASMCFQRVLEVQPDHGPTLNNLAVMQALRSRGSLAVATYRKAMLAMPQDETIHHNVAEFLKFQPRNAKGVGVYKGRLMQVAWPLSPEEIAPLKELFNQEDLRLAAAKRKEGYLRWGSSWVTEKELDAIKEKRNLVQQRVDEVLGLSDQNHEVAARLYARVAGDSGIRHAQADLSRRNFVSEKGGIAPRTMGVRPDPRWASVTQLNDVGNAYVSEANALGRALTLSDEGYSGVYLVFDADRAPVTGQASTSTTRSAPVPASSR